MRVQCASVILSLSNTSRFSEMFRLDNMRLRFKNLNRIFKRYLSLQICICHPEQENMAFTSFMKKSTRFFAT